MTTCDATLARKQALALLKRWLPDESERLLWLSQECAAFGGRRPGAMLAGDGAEEVAAFVKAQMEAERCE